VLFNVAWAAKRKSGLLFMLADFLALKTSDFAVSHHVLLVLLVCFISELFSEQLPCHELMHAVEN
jgi:hypothetical protein